MTQEKDNEGLLEAVLFLAGRYLSLQEIVMFTNINPITVRELLEKLQNKYQSHTAFEIVCKNERYKMDVKSQYSHLVNKLATGQTEFTKAEQETLAIIAYKQPITQAIVVKIRGNKAYDHIKHLIDVGLIKAKKSKHTFELILDESFYNYFNVEKRQKQEEEMNEEIGDEKEEETENNGEEDNTNNITDIKKEITESNGEDNNSDNINKNIHNNLTAINQEGLEEKEDINEVQ